ncbi:hypothetical protein FCV43_07770 [Vibrio genomosp. F6]|uniref:hypothetical protein n=1 Tax=Vibrio genomosp. F6 TaxID=723172 RepID=UPI0010BDA066|nr:hypothetical protein [Vibrio genomosp. F6]TKF22349.1 hypothetical protein FCV43_07770 [Vibrio genomosp. F6]
MAAQKLTKGRLVQIIIMLSLLIVAFTWRTINYKDEKNITCKLRETCAFQINKTNLLVTNSSTGITLNTPENLTIKAEIIDGTGNIDQHDKKLIITKQSNNIKLKISSENEIVYLTLLN